MAHATSMTRRDWLRALGTGAVGWPWAGCWLPAEATWAGEPGTTATVDWREIEQVLWKDILAAWYPRCLDRASGGFHQGFAEDWSRLPADSKFIVFQARMTW